MKRFAFKLELLAEDQAELRTSLLSLLRLLVENMTELVIDDRWLFGQIEVVGKSSRKPLSSVPWTTPNDASSEVVFKQSQLKHSLQRGRLEVFEEHAGRLRGSARRLRRRHLGLSRQDRGAAPTGSAPPTTSPKLEKVLAEVMRETRTIQINAQRPGRIAGHPGPGAGIGRKIRSLERNSRPPAIWCATTNSPASSIGGAWRRCSTRSWPGPIATTPLLCVALLDIDNFKKLNDTLGHEAGDAALIHLATVCRTTPAPQDTVAPYGGEEFIIPCPTLDSPTPWRP